MVGSRRSFLVYIAAILCYEPVLAQPLGFIHGFASAIEQSAVQRTVSIPNFRHAVFVLKFRVAFLRASGKAVPSLHPSSLFRVSGTQRIHFTTDAMTAPLTLTPKSIRNFQGECALTRNRSVPQECAACIHRMQNIRGLGTAQQAF